MITAEDRPWFALGRGMMVDALKLTSAGGAAAGSDRRFLTIRQWLFLLLALFLVVPLVITNLLAYQHSRQYLLQASFRSLGNVASLEASQVLLSVQRTEDLVAATVAADPHLADAARSLAMGDDSARRQARQELRALQRKLSGAAPVEEMEIASPNGAPLVSTLAHASEVGDAVFRCTPPAGERPVVAEVLRRESAPSLLVASALRDARGAPWGALCARIRFDIHQQLMRARREHTTRGTLYLLDQQGGIISDSLASGPAAYGQPFWSGGRTMPLANQRWTGRYVLASGVEALAAYEPIPALQWGVAVEVPVAVALAALRQLEWEAGLVAAALLLVVIGAAVWSWRIVVHPLQSLSRTAERLSAGATGETVVPSGSREIAELAMTFNRMSVALWESQHSLEHRIAERTRELRDTQEFAELLLNSIDHRVVVVDRDYRIVKANAAAVRMYGPSVVGLFCYGVFEGRSTRCDNCPATRTFASGRAASEERSQHTGNGREAVRVETHPVFGADGQVASVIEIARVVTAEKHLQMQAMHQERMAAFGLAAAGIAHDIGNPLAAIQSQLQVAHQQPSRQSETLAIVSAEIARISRTLRETIDFARRRRDARMLISVNQVVEDVARLLSHDPRARTVSVVRRLAAKLPGIRTTEDHLFQVLLNLGLNGLDAMPGGGTLELETRGRGGWVVVSVRDTGHGIPTDLRERVFEPLFTTKTADHGNGLGLFVSKGIVESMGGELTLEQTDARGTVFAVYLPVDPSPDSRVSA